MQVLSISMRLSALAAGYALVLGLHILYPSEIVRTRDPKVLAVLPIVVDVGATYDPSKHRYDHHQRGFKVSL